MRAARSTQSQSIQLQDPLEVRKQHLDFLSIFARLLVKTGFRDGASHIACGLIDAALDPSYRRVGTAASLYRAGRTIGLAGRIVNRVVFGDVGTWILEWAPVTAQRMALRAAVFVAFFVPLKITAGQGVIGPSGLIP